MDNTSRCRSSSTMTESSNTKYHPILQMSSRKSSQESRKFIDTLLSQTIRVGGPSSGLVSWPNITINNPSPQMKGIFHYIAEEVSRLILLDPTTYKCIQEFIRTSDASYFDRHVPRIFTAFIENLVLEVNNNLLEIVQIRDPSARRNLGLLERLRGSKAERDERKRLSAFKSTRLSVVEMLNMIWEYRSPIFDEPKQDVNGNNYWASNIEALRYSRSLVILKEELIKLRRPIVATEAVGFEVGEGRRWSGST